MDKNKWFDDVFLPSLFNRSGVCVLTWISKKQVDVCRQYMHLCQARYETRYGTYGTLSYREYRWRERKVSLYVVPNGAGKIYFDMDDKEKDDFSAAQEKRALEKERKTYEKMRDRHPEKYLSRLEEAKKELETHKMYLDEAKANGNPEDIADEQEDYDYYLSKYNLIALL